MKYKKSIRGFIEALSELAENRVSGHVVLITEDGVWGKFLIAEGQLYSLSLGELHGKEVLEYLKGLDEVQFMFRPTKGDGEKVPPAEIANAMSNEVFFNFFNLLQPKVGSGQQPHPIMTDARGESNKGKGRILVVDDSALARKVVSSLLNHAGYQITEAKDGLEALGQLEMVRPDLVILDLIMPQVDGYQVVAIMKKNPVYRSIPIIMLTSRDSLMDRLKGKMSASDAYITKPVKQDELMMYVTRLLG